MTGGRWFPDEMPVPAVSRETVPWWEAAAQHRLVVQRCGACRATRHPPSPRCPRCHSGSFEWQELDGTGTVYTYTVVHQAFVPALAAQLPYIVAAVELSGGGGARLVTNLVDIAPEDVEIGMSVTLVWEDMGPELSLPRFRGTARR